MLNDLDFMAFNDFLRIYELEVTASTQKGFIVEVYNRYGLPQGRICLHVAGFNDTSPHVDLTVCSLIWFYMRYKPACDRIYIYLQLENKCSFCLFVYFSWIVDNTIFTV